MLPQVADLPDQNRHLADLRCREGGSLSATKASKSGDGKIMWVWDQHNAAERLKPKGADASAARVSGSRWTGDRVLSLKTARIMREGSG